MEKETTFIERLQLEAEELKSKTVALEKFMDSENFKSIDKIQQDLLRIQLSSMASYLLVLATRLRILNN